MEKRDLYDINRNLTGETIYKGEQIPPNRYIVVVLAFIQNSKGEFLIQKRSPQKDGKYASTGGHPKSGESSLQGIITEIKEEIGLNVNSNDLQLVFSGREDHKHVFFDIYYLKQDFNINDLTLQKEEVDFVEWDSPDQIKRLITDGLFLENHAEEFYRLIDILKNGPIGKDSKSKVELRKFKNTDIDKIDYFFNKCTEWKNWDAPWEDWSFNKENQIKNRLKRTNHEPCFEYEIIYNNEHIGWISAYYMTNDFKWNDLTKTNKIAIGIDIPDTKYRGLGIGKQAYKKYLNYFKSLEYTEIYTQTWSGNTPMINLALSVGFKEVNRFKNLRNVNGKQYDALTFKINL